ncbi:MAG: tetratricopeptide repeat protein [Bryobacter sp.]|jgi:tetratricopeptide (TPR) repeat protein|nr:tetratricopeptide repeat protein [Bryobacter sp. CoA8 C33]
MMRYRTGITLLLAALAGWAQGPASSFTNSPTPAPLGGLSPQNRPDLSPEMRGDIYMARKMYREAVEMYGKMPSDSHVSWNKMGIAYHQLGQLGLARKSYERSMKLSPKYAEAINNLGTVAYAQKNYRRATNYYRKALVIAPESASMHSNLGTALFARKKYEAAILEYQKALELDPNVFEHRGSQGTVLQERSVEERAKFHYELAKVYAKTGQGERALQYLRKALEEGYKDREKIAGEAAFAELKENPEFQAILKTEFRAL